MKENVSGCFFSEHIVNYNPIFADNHVTAACSTTNAFQALDFKGHSGESPKTTWFDKSNTIWQ